MSAFGQRWTAESMKQPSTETAFCMSSTESALFGFDHFLSISKACLHPPVNLRWRLCNHFVINEETVCIASSSTKWIYMHDRISLLNVALGSAEVQNFEIFSKSLRDQHDSTNISSLRCDKDAESLTQRPCASKSGLGMFKSGKFEHCLVLKNSRVHKPVCERWKQSQNEKKAMGMMRILSISRANPWEDLTHHHWLVGAGNNGLDSRKYLLILIKAGHRQKTNGYQDLQSDQSETDYRFEVLSKGNCGQSSCAAKHRPTDQNRALEKTARCCR